MLLDESHLQLVVDVLKEANFNDEDCYWLGQELGVYDERVGHIYPGNFLDLKECLRKWLQPGTTSNRLRIQHDGPLHTLYDLAAALKSIGKRGAADYIIRTCKLVTIMYKDQYY